jgi:hypothetical protein
MTEDSLKRPTFDTTDFFQVYGQDPPCPERKLLIAVLRRAINDFFSKSEPLIAWEAGQWLFSDLRGPMSMWWICGWLSDDADGLRSRILASVKAGKRPPSTIAFRIER